MHQPGPPRQRLVLASLFAALTVVGTYIRVPLPLVPFSLQTFFVLLAGNLLGARAGAWSQCLYLTLGLAGLPVFTRGGGPAYVLQPTFGYLLGFPLASYLAGRLLHGHSRQPIIFPPMRWTRLLLANGSAMLALLGCGVSYLWLSSNLFLNAPLSLPHAIWVGAVVFLPADLLKILFVAWLYRCLQPFLIRARQPGAAPAACTPELTSNTDR